MRRMLVLVKISEFQNFARDLTTTPEVQGGHLQFRVVDVFFDSLHYVVELVVD